MSSSDVETDCPTTLGYDAAFSPDLDEKYKCPVCLVALRDPLQTVCGHRFCRVCLTRSRGYDIPFCFDSRRTSSANFQSISY